jgi:aminoglycoside/choline kinase family phosphotransferase
MLEKRLGLPPAEVAAIKGDLKKIGRKLLRAPRVVVHRDLQSTNVILKDGRPCFIDFQGMRWGAAAYDLASLLCDPYMELTEPLQLRLLDFYAAKCGDATVRDLFWPAAIQRLAQALGAFAKLGAARETLQFGDHIPAALRMMKRALSHVRGLPHLRAWAENFQ